MAGLPSLRQLRYLVAVAERLNFTRAAEDCHVTQSTMSAGIRELEDTLGVRLVERDRQSVWLTPAGDGVVERARALLAQAQDLAAFAVGAGAPLSGTVRVGAIPTIAPFVLPGVLPDLRERMPDLRFALREDLTAALIDRLRSGKLDFALIALPYELDDESSFVIEPLFDDELWLAGPARDAALRSSRVRIDPAVIDRLILLEEGHCLREHALAACGGREARGGSAIEATSLLTLLEMVESGLGLALVPEMAIKAGLLNRTGLVARPMAAPAPIRGIALIARRTSARMEAFSRVAARIAEWHRAASRRPDSPARRGTRAVRA